VWQNGSFSLYLRIISRVIPNYGNYYPDSDHSDHFGHFALKDLILNNCLYLLAFSPLPFPQNIDDLDAAAKVAASLAELSPVAQRGCVARFARYAPVLLGVDFGGGPML